jgi:hypothetical protein
LNERSFLQSSALPVNERVTPPLNLPNHNLLYGHQLQITSTQAIKGKEL